VTEVSAGETNHAAALTRKLEAVFGMIERERMGDIPILNPALSVAAIGMRPFEETWVCTLVTPWFINLMLLPRTPEVTEAWNRVGAGTKVRHDFPAGTFEFICGTEDALGPYRMCSLFSPVHQFENQDAALATAEGALAALFDGFDENLDNVREPVAPTVPPKKDAAQVSRRTLF
jgi:[NiFe] hydrogenase assembly HybE family chaperone